MNLTPAPSAQVIQRATSHLVTLAQILTVDERGMDSSRTPHLDKIVRLTESLGSGDPSE